MIPPLALSILFWLLLAAAVITAGTLAMTLRNLRRYRPAPPTRTANPPSTPLVSVCIPARNEEANLRDCVRSFLAGDYRNIEVLVYDDHSTDATPHVLDALIGDDPRVRRVPTAALPAGWNGKQFGCDRMGRAADGDWLLFTDADVRFAPDAVGRTLAQAERSGADLISTFPRQITVSFGEALLVPLIHFILFSYLPMGRMRRTRSPSASAGCGQFLFVRREPYRAAGGHSSFRDSMHDGIKLPRSLRRAGYRTDLFDGTSLASVRMYRGFASTWRGFAKNAFEGLGSVALLAFITTLHLVGHVLPWAVLAALLVLPPLPPPMTQLGIFAVAAAFLQRLILAKRFDSSILSAVLHPVGVTLMTALQWHSLYLALTGQRSWRGRSGDHPLGRPHPDHATTPL